MVGVFAVVVDELVIRVIGVVGVVSEDELVLGVVGGVVQFVICLRHRHSTEPPAGLESEYETGANIDRPETVIRSGVSVDR